MNPGVPADRERPAAVARALRFIEDPTGDRFEAAALEVARFQIAGRPAYRRFCESRGVRPSHLRTWEEVPYLPSAAFKVPELFAARAIDREPERVFLTSGTTRGPGGHGRHPLPELSLYAASWTRPFRDYVLPDRERIRILSLVPEESVLPQSSLSYMVSRIRERFDTTASRVLLGPNGLEPLAIETLEAAAAGPEPVLLVGTGLGFLALLDDLAARGRSLMLPHPSRLVDTGGWKGHARGSTRPEMLRRYRDLLGIPPERVVGEYGMTELSSQFYETSWRDHLEGRPPRDPRVYAGPPWVRTRVLDPGTLRPLPPGIPGLLAHFDLANAWTVSAVLTEDLGAAREGGFELLGRAHGAELRGCSLATEELLGD